jgi:hypothetical protein
MIFPRKGEKWTRCVWRYYVFDETNHRVVDDKLFKLRRNAERLVQRLNEHLGIDYGYDRFTVHYVDAPISFVIHDRPQVAS